MAKLPGMAVYHGASESLPSSGGLEPGMAVGWDGNGRVALVNSGGSVTTVAGVVSNTVDPSHEQGDLISIQTSGTIITATTSGVTAGSELGVSATDGTLTGGGSGSAGQAFSSAGGSYHGSIPSGHSAVRFGGVV